MRKKLAITSSFQCLLILSLGGCAHGIVHVNKSPPSYFEKILTPDSQLETSICLTVTPGNKKSFSDSELDSLLGPNFVLTQIDLLLKPTKPWRLTCENGMYRYLIEVDSDSGLSRSSKAYQSIYIALFYGSLGVIPLYTNLYFETSIQKDGVEIYKRDAKAGALAGLIMIPFAPFSKNRFDIVKEEISDAIRSLALVKADQKGN